MHRQKSQAQNRHHIITFSFSFFLLIFELLDYFLASFNKRENEKKAYLFTHGILYKNGVSRHSTNNFSSCSFSVKECNVLSQYCFQIQCPNTCCLSLSCYHPTCNLCNALCKNVNQDEALYLTSNKHFEMNLTKFNHSKKHNNMSSIL